VWYSVMQPDGELCDFVIWFDSRPTLDDFCMDEGTIVSVEVVV
jgi:hypothetical protein